MISAVLPEAFRAIFCITLNSNILAMKVSAVFCPCSLHFKAKKCNFVFMWKKLQLLSRGMSKMPEYSMQLNQTWFCHLLCTISLQLCNKQFGDSQHCPAYFSLKIINSPVFITRQLYQPVFKILHNLNFCFTQYNLRKLDILYNVKPGIFPTGGDSTITDPWAMQCLQGLVLTLRGG